VKKIIVPIKSRKMIGNQPSAYTYGNTNSMFEMNVPHISVR
jgi:hypothetical protein